MARKQISKRKIQNLIFDLARGTNLQTAIRRRGYALGRALQVLRGGKARSLVKAVRALARIQQSLIIHSIGATALNTLRRHLTKSAKPEHQIKGALSLLTLAKPPRRTTPKPNPRQKHNTPLRKIPDDTTAMQSLTREAHRCAARRIKQFES